MLSGKEFTCQGRRPEFDPWVRKNPLEKEMATHSSILQENPIDRGAWWATVHGFAKESDIIERACMPVSYLVMNQYHV